MTQAIGRLGMTVGLLAGLGGVAQGVELVKEGVGRAVVWVPDERGVEARAFTERKAAETLVEYIEKMSGAVLPIRTVGIEGQPRADEPAILVGKAALAAGLDQPPVTLGGDGYRIQTRGSWVLLAGETPDSTFFAASHLLERFGCRWYIDNPLGTVVPTLKTLETGDLNLEEKPSFPSRSLWGPNWRPTMWSRHNRLGGLSLSSGHNWPSWFCTQDPAVRASYLSNVAARVRGKGVVSTSISPPDGTRYCSCEKCRALDDPTYIEPSTGSPVMSDRYQEFYNFLGREILAINPQAILCHYAYADYTLPPKRFRDAPDNLCVFLAPIRFCRLHSLSNPLCEARQRARAMVEGWAKVEKKMGWREYNYNLAECTMPLSKISVWREDIPWLYEKGCIGLNIECLYLPHLYEPHTWLVARLAWDAKADVNALLDDFYERFCGPAAPHVKAYWERVDRAYRETDAHSGSFFGLPHIWTRALLTACTADLDAAAESVKGRAPYAERVAMFRKGLDNVRFFLDWLDAVHRCDFERSQAVYDAWMAHMEAIHAARIHPVGEYKYGYAPRFLGPGQAAGYARVTNGRRKVFQFPDEWEFRYDRQNEGEGQGWFRPDAGGEWRRVRTFTSTLSDQGVPEELTVMWYRAHVRLPADVPEGPLTLWFMEPDANEMGLWVDGKLVRETAYIKARQPLDVDVTGLFQAGREHVVTVKLNHRRISELKLGGLLRPVMIYSGTPPEPAPTKKQKGRIHKAHGSKCVRTRGNRSLPHPAAVGNDAAAAGEGDGHRGQLGGRSVVWPSAE